MWQCPVCGAGAEGPPCRGCDPGATAVRPASTAGVFAGVDLPTVATDPGACPECWEPGATVTFGAQGGSGPSHNRAGGARLEVFGEIARGGRGAVLRGRDVDLGRELAIKVLLEHHAKNPDLTRRFVEEAQIAGQLQHPGIVPVYELGCFPDARPYFAMKLVRGRTFAEVLRGRPTPIQEICPHITTWIKICETVAYAHARGVIHRDLKPANVMLGGFGEVQVMDWGLAKVLPREGEGGEVEPIGVGFDGILPVDPEATIVTARTADPDSEHSRAGTFFGTPGYASPEQARGELDRVDERTDVFALGSILCEILTGRPAFTGTTFTELATKAARGDVADAFARLDVSEGDREMIELARECLAPDPDDRPRNAALLAARATARVNTVAQRLREAEVETAAEAARAEEAGRRLVVERQRRQSLMALAASVLALTVVGCAWLSYWNRQRQERQHHAEIALRDVALLRDLALDHPEDVRRWEAALHESEDAEREVDEAGDPIIRSRLDAIRARVQAGLDAARRDRDLVSALADARAEKLEKVPADIDATYARLFRDAGLDVDAGDRTSPAIGEAIRARPDSIRDAIVAALDDWAILRDGEGRARVLAAARAADPDPYRDNLRATLLLPFERRLEPLRALAADPKSRALPPASAILLAVSLRALQAVEPAVEVLRSVAARHPSDLWAHHELGNALTRLPEPEMAEALGHFEAARAIRPESAHFLAHALEDSGRLDEALPIHEDMIARRPEVVQFRLCLAKALRAAGRDDEAKAADLGAIELAKQQVESDPSNLHAREMLASALYDASDFDATLDVCREILTRDPKSSDAYYNIGLVAARRGDLDAAIKAFRSAIEIRPSNPYTLVHLGDCYMLAGRPKEAIPAFRTALAIRPTAYAWHHLGKVLRADGQVPEAISAFRQSIRLNPGKSEPHNDLGRLLSTRGDHAAAVAELRESVRLEPSNAFAHYNLGTVLQAAGQVEPAIASYREAIRIRPEFAQAHCNLGGLLRAQHDYAGSLAEYRKGHELGQAQPNWKFPSADWLREAERLADLSSRLDAILKGDGKPKDNADRLALAGMAHDRGLTSAATTLWTDALAADPKLADDRTAQVRYNAACSASLAAAAPGLTDDARLTLRNQAQTWLRAELSAWTALLKSDPQSAPRVQSTLTHWLRDPDLEPLRTPDRLAPAERAPWKSFWEDVRIAAARAS